MVNRYRGNGSPPERVQTPGAAPRPQGGRSPLPPQQGGKPPPRERPGGSPRPGGPKGPGSPPPRPKPGKAEGTGEPRRGLEQILARLDPGKLETEDLLVLAILWLLYRDSGDKELLIAMGAYLFL